MKHCGVVTDRSYFKDSKMPKYKGIMYGICGDDLETVVDYGTSVVHLKANERTLCRIYSDEVPMADKETIDTIKNSSVGVK